MRGLDPRIHLLVLAKRMNCRVKPGNDNRFNMTGKRCSCLHFNVEERRRTPSSPSTSRRCYSFLSSHGRQRWGARQILLGMPNTTYAWCTCDPCATSDFWTLKRDPSIKRYPSGVCPSPARETAPGFSLRGRGAPQKRPGFFGAQRRGPKRKRFPAAASPHPQIPKPAEE